MGRRGPIPKPRHLRVIDGAERESRQRREPNAAGIPTPPAFLRGEARREWFRVTNELRKEGIVSLADRGVLTCWCSTWARLRQAEEALAKLGGDGLSVPGTHGGQSPRVEIRVARDCVALLAKLAESLGLSPSSRQRLGMKPEPLSNPDFSSETDGPR